jgi:hypothetical protein
MTQADGVCVFCSRPFCQACGVWKNNIFCCNSHSDYEIIEQLACVRYLSDAILIDYIVQNLQEHGLHPFIYKNDFQPYAFNNAVTSAGLSDIAKHHNERRIMLPFSEILTAENILADLESDIPGLEL